MERTRQGLLDKSGLDHRKPLHILNNPMDIPFLIRTNHKHIPRWPRVLSLDDARAPGVSSLKQVSGVVNNGAGDPPGVEVRLNVGADLHLEMVEALMKRFER